LTGGRFLAILLDVEYPRRVLISPPK